MKAAGRVLLIAAFLAASTLGGFLAGAFGPGRAQAAPAAAAGFGPSVKLTMLDVPNQGTGAAVISTTALKVRDIGTFVVESDASLVEVTHQGRLYVGNFPSASGVIFELRVNDALGMIVSGSQNSGLGLVRSTEPAQQVPNTFSGYWTGLPPGTHTVSIWVRTSSGTANSAIIDPGGWLTNIVTIKEFLPYGVVHMPAISR